MFPIDDSEIERIITETAEAYSLNPTLMIAQCKAESAFNPTAKSPAGALGLFQLMPATAAEFGCTEPFNVQQNVTAAAKYMNRLLLTFGDDYAKALAAYNWGPGNLQRLMDSNPINWKAGLPKETRDYLSKILS